MTNLKGLIFDLDGVITDTAKLHYLAWKKIVEKININLTEEINEQIKGLPRKDTLLKILEIFNVNNLDAKTIDDMCFEKNQYYLELLESSISEKDILPGIKKLLDDAKNSNCKLAISSSSLNAKLILTKLNILNYFDYIVDPKTISNGKPAPDIYLSGASGLKLDVNECVGFEDASVGIEGLNKAKIFSIGINSSDEYVKNNSSIWYSNTAQIDFESIKKEFEKRR